MTERFFRLLQGREGTSSRERRIARDAEQLRSEMLDPESRLSTILRPRTEASLDELDKMLLDSVRPEERHIVSVAQKFTRDLCSLQEPRKLGGSPAYVHPAGVSIANADLREKGVPVSTLHIVGALLHDTYEDFKIEDPKLRFLVFRNRFLSHFEGAGISDDVNANLLSIAVAFDKHVNPSTYLPRLAEKNCGPTKICDRGNSINSDQFLAVHARLLLFPPEDETVETRAQRFALLNIKEGEEGELYSNAIKFLKKAPEKLGELQWFMRTDLPGNPPFPRVLKNHVDSVLCLSRQLIEESAESPEPFPVPRTSLFSRNRWHTA